MKLQAFIRSSILLPGLILLIFSQQDCRKKEPGPVDKKPDVKPIPKELYGTWHLMNSTYQYFEFVEGSGDSFYNMLEHNMRLMNKGYCRITPDSIIFEAVKYRFTVTANTLTLHGALYLERADNKLINHTNWQRKAKLVRIVPLPRGFVTDYPTVNFGLKDDTIYYYHSGGQVMCYNLLSNEYLDSFPCQKVISSCIANPPFFYYYSKDSMWKSTGFKSKIQYSAFSNMLDGRALSLNKKANVFYLHGDGEMYSAPEGGSMTLLSGFDAKELRLVMHYHDNEFLLKDGFGHSDNLGLVSYDGTWSAKPVSYDVIPGHDIIGPIATDGQNIWVCARNNHTLKYELVKIELQ
jgi:hypothetical protein